MSETPNGLGAEFELLAGECTSPKTLTFPSDAFALTVPLRLVPKMLSAYLFQSGAFALTVPDSAFEAVSTARITG